MGGRPPSVAVIPPRPRSPGRQVHRSHKAGARDADSNSAQEQFDAPAQHGGLRHAPHGNGRWELRGSKPRKESFGAPLERPRGLRVGNQLRAASRQHFKISHETAILISALGIKKNVAGDAGYKRFTPVGECQDSGSILVIPDKAQLDPWLRWTHHHHTHRQDDDKPRAQADLGPGGHAAHGPTLTRGRAVGKRFAASPRRSDYRLALITGRLSVPVNGKGETDLA